MTQITAPPRQVQQRPQVVEDSSDSEEELEFDQVKILVLGDGAVGKTSLIQRFVNDHFAQSYKQTIGVDFCTKRLTFEKPTTKQVCLQIWDIGGQSIGGKMIQSYLHKADAVLLCYDITSFQSFENLKDWLSLVKQHCNAGSSETPDVNDNFPHLVLVGTKADLQHLRAVKAIRHTQFCEVERMKSAHFVSSKLSEGVDTMFYKVAADLIGISLTQAQESAYQKPVVAEIIDHPRNDPALPVINATHKGARSESKKKCAIM
ncbi:unnamed protein product [Amoebophrya sp. A120]|nr:unnamed protein product [Amoebophrya sp. A120]|eukprot:GSA120T00003831001.1